MEVKHFHLRINRSQGTLQNNYIYYISHLIFTLQILFKIYVFLFFMYNCG